MRFCQRINADKILVHTAAGRCEISLRQHVDWLVQGAVTKPLDPLAVPSVSCLAFGGWRLAKLLKRERRNPMRIVLPCPPNLYDFRGDDLGYKISSVHKAEHM
jgi:hypothetical protein